MIPHQALILWRMLTAAYGTKRTCRAELTMSVDGVKRKSAVSSQTDAIDPNRT